MEIIETIRRYAEFAGPVGLFLLGVTAFLGFLHRLAVRPRRDNQNPPTSDRSTQFPQSEERDDRNTSDPA